MKSRVTRNGSGPDAQARQVEAHIAAIEPGLHTKAQRISPALGRVFDREVHRGVPCLTFDAGEVFDVLALDREAHATPCHRDNQRFDKRVDALDRLVRTVVDGDVVAASSGTGHGQQAHRWHRTHLEDGFADALVRLAGQAVTGELVQVVDRTVDGLDPGLAACQIVVEARVLVEELELLQWGWEVDVRSGKCRADIVWHWATLALFGTIGTIQDVALSCFEFAGSLQHHLDDVLDFFDARDPTGRLGGHNVDHATRQFGDCRVRLATKTLEAPGDCLFDPVCVKLHPAPIALENGGRSLDCIVAVGRRCRLLHFFFQCHVEPLTLSAAETRKNEGSQCSRIHVCTTYHRILLRRLQKAKCFCIQPTRHNI